jgi:hypothetical protein
VVGILAVDGIILVPGGFLLLISLQLLAFLLFVCVSAVPHEHAVAGGFAVTGFPAVDGILAVGSIPSDPGFPILAGGFTYWTVVTVLYSVLSDYWNSEYRIGNIKELSD